MRRHLLNFGFAFVSCGLVGLSGCGGGRPPVAPPEPPVVTVERPVVRELDSVTEYTGRLAAVESLTVQSQVTGYLKEIKFKDGDIVQPGQILYEIDPAPYEAALLNAKALVAKSTSDLATAEQNMALAAADFDRAKRAAPGTLSAQEIDQFRTAYDTAKSLVGSQTAALEAAKATEKKADFDRTNCSIRNEVKLPARVSRTLITPGNLVVAGQTTLCKIISLDPIYAYWDVDEDTSLRYRQQVFDKKVLPNPRDEQKLACWIGLKDETRNELGRWPHKGLVDYIAPEIVRGSGTREVRGVLENANYRLGPGDSVRVQVMFGPAEKIITIPELAVGSQQQQKFVYCVVEKDGKQIAEFRPVELGPVRELKGVRLQLIKSGVTPEDRVVVNGLLRVRPGIELKPTEQASAVPVAESKSN